MKMKYQLPKIKNDELLDIFPEAREIIPQKIKECRLAMEGKEVEIQNALADVYALKTDEFSEWFYEKIIETFMLPDLKILERQLFRLNSFLPIINPDKYPANDFQDQIEIARNYPIYELARDKLELKQAGNNFISFCPFHDEKTPSFYIYPDSNQFHCYGCQEHGDIIKLTMALYGLEFREAVIMLKN